jgi:putative effector of murein hydrolase
MLGNPLFLLTFTIGAFLCGVALERRTGSSLANPTLVAIVAAGLLMRVTGVTYLEYARGLYLLSFLLGPATVALAIPLARSLSHLRKSLVPTLIALIAGSLTGAVSAYVLVRAMGGDRVLALTMMPKSLTTPIALEVSQNLGGLPSLTAVFAIMAGILTAVALPAMRRVLRINDEAATGLAAGTAGSGIATARAISIGPLAAAFAGVAIGTNGFITALLAPYLARILNHFQVHLR